jgi:hypothetical protein
MYILAWKVKFDMLQTELDRIGEHNEHHRLSSDFAEVSSESPDLGRIGGVFRRAASGITELVEQLCGVTAVTADCPDRSRGLYTGGSGVGDVKDCWGLDSPAPSENRNMILVVASSLLSYVNSHCAKLLLIIGV